MPHPFLPTYLPSFIEYLRQGSALISRPEADIQTHRLTKQQCYTDGRQLADITPNLAMHGVGKSKRLRSASGPCSAGIGQWYPACLSQCAACCRAPEAAWCASCMCRVYLAAPCAMCSVVRLILTRLKLSNADTTTLWCMHGTLHGRWFELAMHANSRIAWISCMAR